MIFGVNFKYTKSSYDKLEENIIFPINGIEYISLFSKILENKYKIFDPIIHKQLSEFCLDIDYLTNICIPTSFININLSLDEILINKKLVKLFKNENYIFINMYGNISKYLKCSLYNKYKEEEISKISTYWLYRLSEYHYKNLIKNHTHIIIKYTLDKDLIFKEWEKNNYDEVLNLE